MMMDANQIGKYGEILVKKELLKRGIYTISMPPHYFDFDLYTNNNVRIEVKTARKRTDIVKKHEKYLYEQTCWTFNNCKQNPKKKYPKEPRITRNCDFYVLVCLDDKEDVERFYVVPTELINHESSLIRIHANKTNLSSKSKYAPFLNSWNLILNQNLNNGSY